MANGTVTAAGLNVRATADGPIVGVLRQGCIVQILGQSEGWMNITATQDGAVVQGWASASFIAPDLPTTLPAISERAIQLIVGCEVTSEAVYTANYSRPTWPKGDSGVTIGIGYDVGYVSIQELRSDWTGLLSSEAIDGLSRACGVKGPPAQSICSDLRSIVDVPWSAANTVFRARKIPQTIKDTVRSLPHAPQLPPDCLGALVSLVYNRGASFNLPDDRYREMRAIKDDMADGRIDDIPAQIRSMKRLWEGDPSMKGLVERRESEAALFEDGLRLANTSQVS